MSEELFFNKLVTKSLHPIQGSDRFFEGYLTVEVKDKQGEITIVDELIKVLPIWMDRGAPITDTHSNRVIGKGINYQQTVYKAVDGSEYPAIKIIGKIHSNYELDNEIWKRITSGEYKGLSFGGATKTGRTPYRMKDGSIAYQLRDLEHYEVAVCKDPAVPLALITDFNPVAKAIAGESSMHSEGKMLIRCTNFGCYVQKKEDPCWDGYEQYGMKDKDGKQVPNCVKKTEDEEELPKLTPEGEEMYKQLQEYDKKRQTYDMYKAEPDPEQLKMGIKVEMEHTDDKEVAEKIARDHLNEVADYYTKLKEVEKAHEEDQVHDLNERTWDNWSRHASRVGMKHYDDPAYRQSYQEDQAKHKEEYDEQDEKLKAVIHEIEDTILLIKGEVPEGVELNKPIRTDGEEKKFKVYVKDPQTGNIKIVRFGDPNMEIKRDDDERRESFRARHDCENAKDITTPQYWSCKMWEKETSVTEYTDKSIEDIAKVDLGKIGTFQGKVDALMREGYPRENAEKIVGAFVKGEKKKDTSAMPRLSGDNRGIGYDPKDQLPESEQITSKIIKPKKASLKAKSYKNATIFINTLIKDLTRTW